MWLMTTRGFVSAVEWHGGEHDGKVVLRARMREHLEAVLELAPADGRTDVAISPEADYRYRAWVTRAAFYDVMVALAREVRYSNFKDEVARKPGQGRYSTVLHQAWSIFGRIQPGGPYGTGGRGFPAIPRGEPRRRRPPAIGRRPAVPRGQRECTDCGHVGQPVEFERVSGKWVCADINECWLRSRTG